MYKLIKDENNNISMIQKLDTTQFIPVNEANTDYQEYLQWLDEGNTPEEAE